MNEIMYHLSDHVYYLEKVVEPTKEWSTIENQSAYTHPWNHHIPMKAQIC